METIKIMGRVTAAIGAGVLIGCALGKLSDTMNKVATPYISKFISKTALLIGLFEDEIAAAKFANNLEVFLKVVLKVVLFFGALLSGATAGNLVAGTVGAVCGAVIAGTCFIAIQDV